MNTPLENDKTISVKSLKEKLHIKNDRTIEVYIRDGALPQPINELEDAEMLFDKQQVLKLLGAQTLEEEFINTNEVAKILNVPQNSVKSFTKKGLIPCYRLKNVRGSQVLYLRSQVEAAMKYTIQWSSSFANHVGKDRAIKSIFSKLTSENLGFLPIRTADIFRELMINDKTIIEVSKKHELSPLRIMQIFEMGIRLLDLGLNTINKRMEDAVQIDKELAILKNKLNYYEAKQKQLFDLPHEVHEILTKELRDYDFSTRVLNVFHAAKIYTIGDLVKLRKGELNLSSIVFNYF